MGWNHKYIMDYTRIGNYIKEERKSKEISQMELSVQAGVSQSIISQVEHGNRPFIALETIARICNALGIPLADLVWLTIT